mmetsp:Transcript_33871/g.85261  ORF Transcript_33871/g.85261 Transcript_33871/m.85261 type:complete len:211 (-) Transcript_33871:410-1042(-)
MPWCPPLPRRQLGASRCILGLRHSLLGTCIQLSFIAALDSLHEQRSGRAAREPQGVGHPPGKNERLHAHSLPRAWRRGRWRYRAEEVLRHRWMPTLQPRCGAWGVVCNGRQHRRGGAAHLRLQPKQRPAFVVPTAVTLAGISFALGNCGGEPVHEPGRGPGRIGGLTRRAFVLAGADAGKGAYLPLQKLLGGSREWIVRRGRSWSGGGGE